MADMFRKLLDKKCGKGGVTCPCCNPGKYAGTTAKRRREKMKLNKQARSIMKRMLRDEGI